MTAPTTVDEFIDFVRKSQLLDPEAFAAYLAAARASSSLPDTPKRLARALIRDGFLTFYQAEQLMTGRWRSFYVGGKYKVLERLGQGGMATVYLCEHKVMRRLVALKVLPRVGADDPATLERFHREARAAARLRHPNIVGAYDIDGTGGMYFLVMEYVDGVNLEDYVEHRGPLDPVHVAHYIAQAALGLQHSHEAGLVHRDIKPSNLLLDRAGTVKVLDMGLARVLQDESDHLTRQADTQFILGTLDYLAPEQARDSHDVDIRADIYGLGATSYFLLTGLDPYHEATTAQKLSGLQGLRPRPLREIRPELPAELVAVIDAMLAREPSRRPQTPLAVVDALRPWIGEPIPPPPVAELRRRLSPVARTTIQAAGRRTPGPGTLASIPTAPRSAVLAPPAAPAPAPADTSRSWYVEIPRTRRVAVLAGLATLAAGLGCGAAFFGRRTEPRPTAPAPETVVVDTVTGDPARLQAKTRD